MNVRAFTIRIAVREPTGKNPAAIYAPAVLEPRNSKADVSKIQKLLGCDARMPFERGLKMTYEFYASNQTVKKPGERITV